jgi:hypothetical protein
MIGGGTLDALRVWYAARTIARGKRQTSFQHTRHASEYLVRQVSLGRKAPATKHYVFLSDYDVARVYMNILFLTLNGSMGFFFSFFRSYLLAFFISLFLSRRLEKRSTVQ